MKKYLLSFVLVLFVAMAFGQLGDPFKMDARLEGEQIFLDLTVPEKHYLYADHLRVTDAKGNEQAAVTLPATAEISDPNSGKLKPVYDKPFTAVFAWAPQEGGAAAFHVQYWGCNDTVCFIPQNKVVELAGAAEPRASRSAAPPVETAWKNSLEAFEIGATEAGYQKAGDFLAFLDRAEAGEPAEKMGGFRLFLTDPVAFVRESGLMITILFILIGGLALNLTPCVLPMIPINLAIIGAGAQAGSKSRGFALGTAYGAGIALVYGALGAVIVATGSRFGTIQANPWFNLVIALIFVVLALAMFGVFNIDLTRFQSSVGGAQRKQGSFLVAVMMGAVAALLAGACVAPVVIAVLLLATSIGPAGLILPFVLGFGMALPWPFAGAGLSFLPKPGKWMEYVKYGFGAGIVLFALYYGQLSYRAFLPAEVKSEVRTDGHLVVDGTTNNGLAEALTLARESGRPVFIDFWASWCKNCVAMDKSTFKDAVVKERLKNYIFIKYVAEDIAHENTKAVMDHFGVQGLPTFVVLKVK